MIGQNKVMVAVAGSGKTTYLVREALKVQDENVLITTFTESNEEEIKQKFLDINGHIPSNIVVMTWFTFLINHGVKPFQGNLFDFPVKGMLLVSCPSAFRIKSPAGHPIYWAEANFEKHYFDPLHRLYSDKLAKLVIRCNEKSNGKVIDRISRVFRHIFVDEAQDLAGYDLDIIRALFESSAKVLVACDPRQVTYLTHHEAKYGKYRNGGLLNFLKEQIPKKIPFEVDPYTLASSHRNSGAICEISSKLYPDMEPSMPCKCKGCRGEDVEGAGMFVVRPADYSRYIEFYKPIQLRDNVNAAGIDQRFLAMNFGASKGRGYDRVIIIPTEDMLKWICNVRHELKSRTRARLYVALTRARHSVAIVGELRDDEIPAGFTLFA